jgi:hypothetical protein
MCIGCTYNVVYPKCVCVCEREREREWEKFIDNQIDD